MLCVGLPNFGSIGIQLGGIGGIAPNEKDIFKLGLKLWLVVH